MALAREEQTSSKIMMIRPCSFGFNEQTALTNTFQQRPEQIEAQKIQDAALAEFNGMAELLRQHRIDVIEFQDTPDPHTPDSIFPNNWISTHSDGTIVLYPMNTLNRRAERRTDIVNFLQEKLGYTVLLDFTGFERRNIFLEGTGSLVLDRTNRIAYACISSRTDREILERFGRILGYTVVGFHSMLISGIAIYHTNVMMAIGEKTAVVCLDSIDGEESRTRVRSSLEETGHDVVNISLEQMNSFAGNMLQVKNPAGEKFWVMSSQAFNSLDNEQKLVLESDGKILHSPIDTIERLGGGSARCMMAEIHFPGQIVIP